MRFIILYIFIILKSSLAGQHLIPDYDWQIRANKEKTDKTPQLSARIALGNIFGSEDLVYANSFLRYVSKQDNRIWTGEFYLLPKNDFNRIRGGLHIQQKTGPKTGLGLGYIYSRMNFPMEGVHTIQQSLTFSITRQNHKDACVRVLLAARQRQVLEGKRSIFLHSETQIYYSPGERFTCLVNIRAPSPPGMAFIDFEFLHKFEEKWGYSIGIGVPSPYFGFRLYWRFQTPWHLDIRSQRHPVLGMSYETNIIYNLP